MKQYLLRYKGRNALHLLLLMGQALTNVAISLMLAVVANRLIAHDLKGFLLMISLHISLFFLVLFFAYVVNVHQTDLVLKMTLALRQQYVLGLTKKPYLEVAKRDSGGHLSVLNNDIELIDAKGFTSFYQLVSTIFTTAFSIIALISMDWRILATTLVLALVMTFAPRPFMAKMATLTEKFSQANEHLLGGLNDQLAGYRTLFFANKKSTFVARIKAIVKHFNQEKMTFTKKATGIEVVIGFFSIFAQAALLLVTGLLITMGEVSVGMFMSVGQIAGNVFNALTEFNQLRMNIKSTTPLFEKYALPTPPAAGEKVGDFQRFAAKDMGYTFKGKPVFEGLTFTVDANDKLAVIGSSGSGKSTLILAMLGLNEAYSGQLTYNGQEVRAVDQDSLLEHVAFVEAQSHIYHASLRENLRLWDENISDADLKQVLAQVNLTDLTERLAEELGPDSLSAGQKQRVGLARAFLKNTKLMILDEGTANLDPKNAALIEDALLQNPDLTLVAITHHLRPESKKQFTQILNLDQL